MKDEARLFKSLADETRLKILWLLMEEEELCVCDIMRGAAPARCRPGLELAGAKIS
jgi:hypothetical protein